MNQFMFLLAFLAVTKTWELSMVNYALDSLFVWYIKKRIELGTF